MLQKTTSNPILRISPNNIWRRHHNNILILEHSSKKIIVLNEEISKMVDKYGYIDSSIENFYDLTEFLSSNIFDFIKQKNINKNIKERFGPLNVTIRITRQCNLSCNHCHNDYRGAMQLSLKQFKKVIDSLRKLSVFNINISGGEPTLHSELVSMVKYVSDKGMKVTLSTNAISLTNELVKKLKISGLSNIQISLDSSIEKEHDKIRGKQGAFKETLKNINYLKQHSIDFMFVTTLISQSIDDYISIIDLSYELGASSHKTNTVIAQGVAKAQRSTTNIHYLDKYIDTWNKKRLEYKGKFKVLAETMFKLQFNPEYIYNIAEKGFISDGCPAGILTCSIKEDGDVIPCSFFPDYILGNIINEKFEEIWFTNEKLNKLIERDKFIECGTCNYVNHCGGCRARAFSETNNIQGFDSNCGKQSNIKVLL